MSVTGDAKLASTPRWAATLFGRFIALVIGLGVIVLALSAPALVSIPRLYPVTEPFIWLAITGIILALLKPGWSDDDVEAMQIIVDDYANLDFRGKLLFIGAYLIIGAFAISLVVAVVAIIAVFIVSATTNPFLAIALAIFYPMFDAWAGRKIGWNLFSSGGVIGLGIMWLIAFTYRIPRTVPNRAAHNLRHSFIG